MTIECYASQCPFHSIHTDGPDEGPFCYEAECRVNEAYLDSLAETPDTEPHLYKPGLTLKGAMDQPDPNVDSILAKAEAEHLGSPEDRTGIYADEEPPRLTSWQCMYSWMSSDGKYKLTSGMFFDAVTLLDAFTRFYAHYNGEYALVSLYIKPSHPDYPPIAQNGMNTPFILHVKDPSEDV